MKIIHIMYSGMGGHGDVIFPKIQNDNENQYIIIFIGIEKVFSSYLNICKKLNVKYYYLNYKEKIKSFKKIIKVLSKEKPKIIFSHTETIFPLLIYKLNNLNVKLISFQHVSFKIKKFKNKFFNFFEYIFFDKIIFLTDTYKNHVLKDNKFINLKKKSLTIPTGLKDLKSLKNKIINKKKINVGMSTRLVKGKKILNLINLIKFNYENNKLPLFLSIIGKGVDFKKISRLIEKLKLSKYISLNTLNSENELNIWNNNLSIYIHFSTGETLSTSIIRALRSATPIIASNTSGLKEMINTKSCRNGFLVDDNNYYKILKLIEKLTNKNTLYKKFSKNSFKLYKKYYSLDNSFKKYKKIINLYR